MEKEKIKKSRIFIRLENHLNKTPLISSFSNLTDYIFEEFVKSKKTVTPAKAGVQNYLKLLDSCFRRNDKIGVILTFYENINNNGLKNLKRKDDGSISRRR